MSSADRTQTAPAPAARPAELTPELPSPRHFFPRAVVDLLFSKAGPMLTPADLQGIIDGGAEYAEHAAGNAALVAEGLGCLIAYEAAAGPGAGNFQDGESVPHLLWHLKSHFQAVEAMAAAVGWAASELKARAEQ